MLLSEERQILAAELAMGLLEGPDETRAERLRREDRAFDDAVWWWEETLSGAISQIPAASAPPQALAGIQTALFGKEVKTAQGKLKWKPIVGGIVGVKAVLLSAYLLSRALNTETYVVETRYGEATVTWNTRAGTLQVKSTGDTTLHLWKQTADGYNYLGAAGARITAAIAAGDVIILSADGPLAKVPEPVGRATLTDE
ncbi:hypothetical protein HJ526_15445 [Donghicola sp. C2-DW-16]|uniref:Anti-sigma factor n=1 Tax=Donghicola mangrovi TaxID=2729614 RepID=A0ABX2PHB0_9RHOB|nr:hypothetical protein [Donghicola mangrovi]NVO28824.1 hypothetical protein [Donghicola mangrovi]